MTRKIILCIFFALGSLSTQAQDMTKEQTLAYIKLIYSQINKVYSTSSMYYTNPQQIDSVCLEYDQLVIYYTVEANTGNAHTKIIRSKISGEISLQWEDCLTNTSGDVFMCVQKDNKAQLERLRNAVTYLQRFITKDPFGT